MPVHLFPEVRSDPSERRTEGIEHCLTDFVSLWDGTIMHRSLAERKFLEAHSSEVIRYCKRV